MKKGIELKEKEKNGFRPGVEKEKILKSLNDDDWKHIKLMKELDNEFVKNDEAMQFAIRTDQMYQDYMTTEDACDASLANILMTKVRLDKNSVDILKGNTDRMFNQTNSKLTIRDLEIENINLKRTINKDLRSLYLLMSNLYRHVNRIRIDRKIYYTDEQYTEKVKFVKDEFKKSNLELFTD